MGNFNKFDKGRGGRGGFGGGGRGFGSGPRQMFQAVCSKCGQNCEVPFKPTGERPVFCSNCFKSQGNLNSSSGPGRFAPKSFDRGAPRRGPLGGGFSGHAGGNAPVNTGVGVNKAQLDSLNFKLDKIISLLSSAGKTPEALKAAPEKSQKTAVKKAKKAAKKGKKK